MNNFMKQFLSNWYFDCLIRDRTRNSSNATIYVFRRSWNTWVLGYLLRWLYVNNSHASDK